MRLDQEYKPDICEQHADILFLSSKMPWRHPGTYQKL